MTKNILNLFVFLFSALVGFIVTSCSNEDEPQSDEFKAQVDYIKTMTLDNKGNIGFIPTENEEIYLCPVNSAEDSRDLCKYILNTKWDDDKLNIHLGEYGTIVGTLSDEEGVFDIVYFNVKELPKFTLKVASINYCANVSNSSLPLESQLWICGDCHKVYPKLMSSCPFCGSRDRQEINAY